MLPKIFYLAMLLTTLLLNPAHLWSQAPQTQVPHPQRPDEQEIRMQREQAHKLNKQRQEQLTRDTDKLLKLATELKQYVNKSNENVLSLDVIKKADEIEKLAHSVKEKMKGY